MSLQKKRRFKTPKRIILHRPDNEIKPACSSPDRFASEKTVSFADEEVDQRAIPARVFRSLAWRKTLPRPVRPSGAVAVSGPPFLSDPDVTYPRISAPLKKREKPFCPSFEPFFSSSVNQSRAVSLPFSAACESHRVALRRSRFTPMPSAYM